MSGGYEVPLLRPVSGTLDVVVEDALPEGGQYREAADEPEEPEQDDDDGLLADGGVDFVAILHALATPQSALTIKPRVMFFTRYVPCFVASELVTVLVASGWCATRAQAVVVAQFLLDEGYVARVPASKSDEDGFHDEYALYRFRVMDQPNLFADFSPAERQMLYEGNARRRRRGHSWLEIPLSTFTIALGTSGLANVWMSLSVTWPGVGLEYVSYVLLTMATALWFFFLVLYALKMVFRWPLFKADIHNPVGVNMFSAITMTMLSVGIVFLRINTIIAEAVWWVASSGQTLLALLVCSEWTVKPRSLEFLVPQMFLPVVGLSLIPIGGASLGYRSLGTLFFGVSTVFWIMLFTMFMQRLFFLGVLGPKQVPSMFISVAPPCLIGMAYATLNNSLSDLFFPHSMYGVALFFVVLVLFLRFRHVSIPLSTSWWAYVFPAANFANFTVWFHRTLSTGAAPGAPGDGVSFFLVIVFVTMASLVWVVMAIFQLVYVFQRRLYLPVYRSDD